MVLKMGFHKLRHNEQAGFTLIEMLLVLVAASLIVYMGIGYVQRDALEKRIDTTVLQLEQILNAGLAYYTNKDNSAWPADLTVLRNAGYIASGTLTTSPWNTTYSVTSTVPLFYVWVGVTAADSTLATSYAKMIAGRLPQGYISDSLGTPPMPTASCAGTTCYVVTAIGIPPQNLQNATGVRFAGLYHHGACVPVPDCSVDKSGTTMTPQIMVAPVSVSGLNDMMTSSSNVYPISSFTAYAVSNANPPTGTPPACTGATTGLPDDTNVPACPAGQTNSWRVCLQVVTEKGELAGIGDSAHLWGQYVTVLAITRCAISNETAGSNFNVYSD